LVVLRYGCHVGWLRAGCGCYAFCPGYAGCYVRHGWFTRLVAPVTHVPTYVPVPLVTVCTFGCRLPRYVGYTVARTVWLRLVTVYGYVWLRVGLRSRYVALVTFTGCCCYGCLRLFTLLVTHVWFGYVLRCWYTFTVAFAPHTRCCCLRSRLLCPVCYAYVCSVYSWLLRLLVALLRCYVVDLRCWLRFTVAVTFAPFVVTYGYPVTLCVTRLLRFPFCTPRLRVTLCCLFPRSVTFRLHTVVYLLLLRLRLRCVCYTVTLRLLRLLPVGLRLLRLYTVTFTFARFVCLRIYVGLRLLPQLRWLVTRTRYPVCYTLLRCPVAPHHGC